MEMEQVTDYSFERKVLQANKLVLLDFYAEWCRPCQIQTPILQELAREFGDQLIVARIDVDTNQDVAIRYNIRSIPTMKLFYEGEVVDTFVGLYSKVMLLDALQVHLQPEEPQQWGESVS